jgi:hypothetical protein
MRSRPSPNLSPRFAQGEEALAQPHQIRTRCSGATYMASPGFTPNDA